LPVSVVLSVSIFTYIKQLRTFILFILDDKLTHRLK
jgi:hypothetical protein